MLALLAFSACDKWKDTPAKDLGLTRKYCNIPSAINYNHGFPGVEDNSVCLLPSSPFIGNYRFRDTFYNNAEELFVGDSINFSIGAIDTFRIKIRDFCANGNELGFVANRYYRAESDSIIGNGTQLMCRTADTLSGLVEYRSSDSSLFIEWTVVSDTGIFKHRGRAYKK